MKGGAYCDHCQHLKNKKTLMKCPKCSADRKAGDAECPHCGVDYEYVEQKLKARTDNSALFTSQTSDHARVACPHCGQRYLVPPKKIGVFTKCKKCDGVFETKPLVVPTPKP